MNPRAHLLTAVVIISNVAGNLMLSVGMKAVQGGPVAYAKAFFSPLVLLGVTLLIVWMLSRMTLMSWADLSYILPITALGYVLSAVAGALFLAEHISPTRWAGTLLIVAGIAIVGRTRIRTS
jgi:drug/metabolite transporter (DMT)-like permease